MNNLPKVSMNKADWQSVLRTGLIFLAPLGLIYFGSIVTTLSDPRHILKLSDFMPNSFQVGAMVLYIMNRLLDICRKALAGN